MKLISMTDFVLDQNREPKSQNEQSIAFYYCCNYAKFIKQSLELWMFVPCDENGNVFENKFYPSSMSFSNDANIYSEKYQQAKERCLFEGWNIVDKIDATICIENESKHRLFLPNCMAIEDIIYTDMQLTQTAIKQLSL